MDIGIEYLKKRKKEIALVLFCIIYIYIAAKSFNSVETSVNIIHEIDPETINYGVKMYYAQLLLCVSGYFLISPFLLFIKNYNIKLCYYSVSVPLLASSYYIIERYYHQNSVFMNYNFFHNPALIPFILSLTAFIIPSLDRINIIKEER